MTEHMGEKRKQKKYLRSQGLAVDAPMQRSFKDSFDSFVIKVGSISTFMTFILPPISCF